MTDKVEMSLDDIIAQEPRKYGRRNWLNGGNSRRGETNNVPRRGRGTTTRGAVGVFRNRRGFGNSNLRPAPYSRQSGGGDINARWQHDMYDGPYGTKRSAPIAGGGTTKLLVSNLDFGVSNSDIQELFTEFGPLKSATVHYDKSGRSLGTADVVFDRRADALKAVKQYNGVPLDGRPMNIEMALGSVALLQGGGQLAVGGNRFNQQSRPQLRMGGGGNPRGRGMRGRGGRGSFRGRGRSSGPPPTAEELDAELDAYVNKLK